MMIVEQNPNMVYTMRWMRKVDVAIGYKTKIDKKEEDEAEEG